MIDKYTASYLGLVGLSGALLIAWARYKISKLQFQRSRRIKGLKQFETIKTSTPVDKPIQQAKETAVENIEYRFSIIRKLSFYSIITVWVIALAFPFLDRMPATFISFIVAASAIVVGVAARPFIENLISGIVISFSQPIRIGDTVLIDEKYGTIEDISVTHTIVKMWNWRRYIIPNGSMLSKEIINCTINDTYQWMHVEFYVAYDGDISLVEQLAIDAASKSRHFANYEKPRFWVMGMEDKAYRCWVVAWADNPADAWELGNDIRTELIKQFNSHGIKAHQFELGYSEKPDI